MPNWFDQLREVLHTFYPPNGPANVVGYLQGSASPAIWRSMQTQQQRHQMLILGSQPPTQEEWSAAGVANRGQIQTIRLQNLDGFIVLYGGAVYRPWGSIAILSAEALKNYHLTIENFRRNLPRPRR